MVSFTGSTAVGKLISRTASDTLKKVALELGGKNPQVIFPDADLDDAADAVVFGVYFNVGQCCNSSSRIIVHEDIAEAFAAKVVELSKKVRFGDPLDENTQVGAIVTAEHNAKIHEYVVAAGAAGANVALGGGPLNVPGLGTQFYQPTIIRGVTPDMAIAREEVFGPVLTVLTFRTMDEAIALANDASYGLSAGIWSESVHNCLEFSRRVEEPALGHGANRFGLIDLAPIDQPRGGQATQCFPGSVENLVTIAEVGADANKRTCHGRDCRGRLVRGQTGCSPPTIGSA